MERAVIFDMDGVLIDSMDLHFVIWASLLKPYTNLSREEFNSWSGKSTEDIFELVKKKYGVVGERNEFKRKKDSTYFELKDKVRVFHGVRDFLAKLKGLNLKLGVATSEPRTIADQILDNLGIKDNFSVIVGGEMVRNAKPRPDLFLLSAKLLNVSPEEAVVIEDSPTGIEAAKAAGMKVIAIATTHSKDKLLGADLVIDDLEEVINYLEKA